MPAVLNATAAAPSELAGRYAAIRGRSVVLAAPLSAEDAMVQSMPDASPAKWHLAHTTWFFEQFVLGALPGYTPIHADWHFLFNSYYNSVGPMHARAQRGVLSRPSLEQVLAYRLEVDARMACRFVRGDFELQAQQRIALGLQHEQQHQELLLTDSKHALWCNPLKPAYRDDLARPLAANPAPLRWIDGSEGIVGMGAPLWPDASSLDRLAPGQPTFAFDNESPRHRVLLQPHALASRAVTNAEYRSFIADDGYRTSALWLSAGWMRAQSEAWHAPLYWDDDLAHEFTLGGMRPIDPDAPVAHVSYFEADAFARWAGARLPTEAEWEHAASVLPVRGNFVEADLLHPVADGGADAAARAAGVRPNDLRHMFGDVWEWTASAYAPYPGFRTLRGALGEYNGKFMCGQQVLRGGSCISSADHVRASYRNFFQPPDRWQFSGLRLAKDRP